MTCLKPLVAYYASDVNPTGKRSLVFNHKAAHSGIPIRIPCGQCIECRLDYARQKAVRAEHELRLWAPTHDSSFLSLTYSDKFLPPNNSLVVRDLQLFMKRLRKERGDGIRFMACGEYGDTTLRPHYHVILFNVGFDDKRRCGSGKRGDPIFNSDSLDKIWSLGHAVIGSVSFDSIAYVAKYVNKKVTGDAAKAHYGDRIPEFGTCSRRPGIGAGWFLKYHSEAYNSDSCIVKGKEVKVPRFYDGKLEQVDPALLGRIKRKRRAKARLIDPSDNTSRRKRVKEIVTFSALAQKGSKL